jgi:hypothetical protein
MNKWVMNGKKTSKSLYWWYSRKTIHDTVLTIHTREKHVSYVIVLSVMYPVVGNAILFWLSVWSVCDHTIGRILKEKHHPNQVSSRLCLQLFQCLLPRISVVSFIGQRAERLDYAKAFRCWREQGLWDYRTLFSGWLFPCSGPSFSLRVSEGCYSLLTDSHIIKACITSWPSTTSNRSLIRKA